MRGIDPEFTYLFFECLCEYCVNVCSEKKDMR